MEKNSGLVKFNEFYSGIYQERWEKLLSCLKVPNKKIARLSYSKEEGSLSFIKNSFWLTEKEDAYTELKEDGLRKYYIMDPGSALVAHALNIKKDDMVLDMCSAPGGKALILSEKLEGDSILICNEVSKGRREKLKKVIQDYIPRERREKIFIKGKDALRYGMSDPLSFDKILLDAPCSGERHLITNEKEISLWSEKRTKRLSSLQYGLLCSALLSLKKGGELVYSTCSISPLENDCVIEKLLLKKGESFEIIEESAKDSFFEKTKFGNIYLPDKCGFGPLFFTKLKKL